MVYQKPEVLAQNDAQGSFAAGCPAENQQYHCKTCELAGN